MRIEDLYIDDLCENEERIIIDAIASTIEEDGFDISHFSLFSVEGYTWEFVSNRNAERGFLLFYNPKVVNKPIPQYQLLNGSVAYSFNARNLTEAYIQHNKRIPDEDYYLRQCNTARPKQNIIRKHRYWRKNTVLKLYAKYIIARKNGLILSHPVLQF